MFPAKRKGGERAIQPAKELEARGPFRRVGIFDRHGAPAYANGRRGDQASAGGQNGKSRRLLYPALTHPPTLGVLRRTG